MLKDLVIATDDERIAAVAKGFGAPVVMTSPLHLSGTDRVAEAAMQYTHAIVVNIQGDEPLIDPLAIDLAATALIEDEGLEMSTLRRKILRQEEVASPHVVKVVTNFNHDAIYFSRYAIPFNRGGDSGISYPYFKHIGLYAYRRNFLLGYSSLPVGPLERAESLEQLRALENGYRIRVIETQYDSLGVDTPEDLAHLEAIVPAH
ncbi:MAG: 3-deoxy-manno-octulosonate cytidylyltransferase [Bryobacter sp.]